MKNGFFGFVAIVLIAAAVLAYLSFFVVNPTQQALVLQFGEIRRTAKKPGLYIKVPFVQNVVFFDNRVLDLNMEPKEVIAADKKRLIVDAFARYRIENPVLFFQTVNNVREADLRLSTFLDASLRSELGRSSFTDVVRDKRAELMEAIRKNIDRRAEEIGVNVVDVKIRRADLPGAKSQAVFRRMQTERQREATEIRAQGEEQSRRIRSRADRDATVIVAEAKRDAEKIRGDGDAERNRIFAKAYSKDPDFFVFYRSMQAYLTGMSSNDTRLVISPNSDFFRYFRGPKGTADASGKSGAPAASAGAQ
ncbi:protease modulator HflC [Breoghania sp.]|uniref:protease modulator HflC n=1 Tax=Breoghania sp. TaxID=2065378 RepID=UPI00261AFB9D|nr:protease modulator HflC [Breoghania sp.]MDJ0931190.1 protease modulator HflC [Breoghania sp.]